jgi:protein involved in polysaccharide export with SLBB domain
MPRNITVTGEVNYEGSFTIEKKNLRLTDAIQMAGGVTPDAYIKGARLVRQMNGEERSRRQAVLDALRSSLNRKDSVAWDKMEMGNSYVIGIELDKALANPGGEYDIVLRENDRIDVPEYNGTVKISGDVQFPNTVTFAGDKSYKWYVDKAGGFTETARKSKAFVVYQNGMMARCKAGTKIEPGCEIVVPSKRPKQPWRVSEILAGISSLTGLASIVTAIAYMTKK